MADLHKAVGAVQVLTGEAKTQPYRTGYRVGDGKVAAVVRPGSLLELWRVAQICVRHGTIIITQAANTGLTGGSTPFGAYDRPVVVISTLRLDGVLPIDDGNAAICLAGSTLTGLADKIAPFGRLPHSVIGSSCIGASVVGGICNNSGGALVRRGPAFTRKALYARISAEGALELVNHLGRELGSTPQEILRRLDAGDTGLLSDVSEAIADKHDDYIVELRKRDGSPARFNADPKRLFEASGSAGKLIVFAVRVPTYPAPKIERTFLVTSDDPSRLGELRQAILTELAIVPSTCEYLDRTAGRLAAKYGRDVCCLLALFGAKAMPAVLRVQKQLDGIGRRFGLSQSVAARISQAASGFAPHPLPKKLLTNFEHHEHALLITTDDDGIEPLDNLLRRACNDEVMRCTRLDPKDAEAAFRLRFATAGATVRIREISPQSTKLASLDVALPKDAVDWTIALPRRLEDKIVAKAIYGHFLCHVFHLDYVLGPGVDREDFEREVKELVEKRGGQMPAEHNFGHLYEAPAIVAEFYRALDPTNTLNPGIGKTSRAANWA